MKRKSLIVLVALAMVLAFTMPAMAAQVFVDGQKLDVSTTVESGTTLVPLRAIFQALGATVNWDGSTQTVTANKAQTTVKLQIGSPTAYKNGQPVSLQVPGKIIQGSTMVPLRFVSESLGANVHWDGTTRTITITSSSETIKPEPQPLPQPKPLPTPEPAPVTGTSSISGSVMTIPVKSPIRTWLSIPLRGFLPGSFSFHGVGVTTVPVFSAASRTNCVVVKSPSATLSFRKSYSSPSRVTELLAPPARHL